VIFPQVGVVMQKYLEREEMTESRASGNNEVEGWKTADQQISREISASELSELDEFPSLSHEDTLALEAMAANRLKVNKPEPIAEYRKPQSSFVASFPAMGMVIRNTMFGAIAIGLVVAFYLGLSGAKLGASAPAPTHVVRAPEPVRTKVATPRHVRSSHSGGGSGAAASASAKGASAKPVVDNTPIPEYKGPSSVTGASVSHRHAYQTISLPGAGEE
jgi:hypothetical protein